jgi:hypothetical protein
MAREAMEKTIVEDNMAKEQALKQQYNQLAFEQDSHFIKTFFEEAKQTRQAKASATIKQWQQNENQSFDSLWQEAKNNLFSKQEN